MPKIEQRPTGAGIEHGAIQKDHEEPPGVWRSVESSNIKNSPL